MTSLHRHQLVRLTDDGWCSIRDRRWDAETHACLAHWEVQRLPLVVTQQAPHAARSGNLALGLAAPLAWRRRRIALAVDRHHVAGFDAFPRVEQLAPALSSRCRDAWRQLCASLVSLGATARVYGSHGWQLLSGLPYVHGASDVDLWVAVEGSAHADAVAAALQAFAAPGAPRLDGELMFPDRRAVAWREWQAWRSGRCRSILTKTLDGVWLVHARLPSEVRADINAAAEATAW